MIKLTVVDHLVKQIAMRASILSVPSPMFNKLSTYFFSSELTLGSNGLGGLRGMLQCIMLSASSNYAFGQTFRALCVLLHENIHISILAISSALLVLSTNSRKSSTTTNLTVPEVLTYAQGEN